MDKDLCELASRVLEAALERTTRDKKGVRFTFPADEALVILQTTLQRIARAGVKPNDMSALSETLEALNELDASARERKLIELVTTRLRAAGMSAKLLK